jgi:hypothetical protein
MLSLGYRGASGYGQKRRLAGSFRLSVISQTLWRDASISPMDSIRTFGQALTILAISVQTVDLITHAELPFSKTIS